MSELVDEIVSSTGMSTKDATKLIEKVIGATATLNKYAPTVLASRPSDARAVLFSTKPDGTGNAVIVASGDAADTLRQLILLVQAAPGPARMLGTLAARVYGILSSGQGEAAFPMLDAALANVHYAIEQLGTALGEKVGPQ